METNMRTWGVGAGRVRAAVRRVLAGAAVALAITALPAAAQTPAPSVIEVRAGDTFSAIAARFTGDVRQWRKLYDPQRSGLRNPDLVLIGMRLELVQNADGSAYLRVAGQGQPPAPAAAAQAPAAAAPAPAAKAPTPASAAAAPAAPAEPPRAAAPSMSVAAGAAPLVVGVLPNIASGALLAQYEPFKRYLERTSGRTVRIVTAAGFRPFFEATMRGDYDVAVTASHFARVGQLDAGLVPVAIFEPRIRALFIGPTEKPIAGPEDVRGKAIAFANPQSLVAMYAARWLADSKLQSGTDYRVVPARSDLGVGRLVLSGEAAAAVMSNGELRQVPKEEAERLKVVHEVARIPNFVVMAHPRIGADQIAKLRALLKALPADKPDGVAFSGASGVTGIVDADDAQMRELDPHVDQTRRAMGTTK